MLDAFMTMIGLDGFGMGTIVTLFVGACIGWCIPQPAWAQLITEMVCRKFGLERFHKDGHHHSEEHDDVLENEEKKED